MRKVQVSFGDPQHGWICLNIQSGDQNIEIDASDICPSFCLLVEALYLLFSYQGETTVTWACEPTEYDLQFRRTGEIMALSIFTYPDSARSISNEVPILMVSGSYDEICLPFWRGMRHLQARFTPNELEERWQNKFPYQELDHLTALLGKKPKSMRE